MEIHHSAAVVLCGPHWFDHRDSLQFHRVDEALRSMRTPYWTEVLIICGDARFGKDVRRLGEHASCVVQELDKIGEKTTIPRRVVPLYDGGGTTLSDVRLVLRWVNATTERGSRTRLRLFTDDWHMPRAYAMCEREAALILTHDRSVLVTPHAVEYGGPPVTDEQIRRERQGLDAYHSGTYCPNTSLAWGKPH